MNCTLWRSPYCIPNWISTGVVSRCLVPLCVLSSRSLEHSVSSPAVCTYYLSSRSREHSVFFSSYQMPRLLKACELVHYVLQGVYRAWSFKISDVFFIWNSIILRMNDISPLSWMLFWKKCPSAMKLIVDYTRRPLFPCSLAYSVIWFSRRLNSCFQYRVRYNSHSVLELNWKTCRGVALT